MKMKKVIALLLLVLLTLAVLTSCGTEQYPAEEIIAALDELIPASAELNEIYFGVGLPIDANEDELIEMISGADTDVAPVEYIPVTEDCKYRTETELKEATYAVFSKEYADFLIERGFTGISSSTVNADGEIEVENAIFARYIETDGVLTRRIGTKDEAMKLGREYDLSSAEVVTAKNGYAVVNVPTTVDGTADVDVRIKLVKTSDGWRLDSPTY